jgi:hypothetical protein
VARARGGGDNVVGGRARTGDVVGGTVVGTVVEGAVPGGSSPPRAGGEDTIVVGCRGERPLATLTEATRGMIPRATLVPMTISAAE